MHSFVSAVAVLAVFSVAQAALNEQESIALLKKCKQETNAPEDPETMYKTQILPESREGKCMLACLAKEKGLIKNGKVDTKAVSEFFETTYADEPDQLEKAAEAVAKCSVLDVSGKDECEKAYSYLSCGKKNGFRL